MRISTVPIRWRSSGWKKLLCPVIPTCSDIGDVKSFAGMGENRERKWGKRKRIEEKKYAERKIIQSLLSSRSCEKDCLQKPASQSNFRQPANYLWRGE